MQGESIPCSINNITHNTYTNNKIILSTVLKLENWNWELHILEVNNSTCIISVNFFIYFKINFLYEKKINRYHLSMKNLTSRQKWQKELVVFSRQYEQQSRLLAETNETDCSFQIKLEFKIKKLKTENIVTVTVCVFIARSLINCKLLALSILKVRFSKNLN